MLKKTKTININGSSTIKTEDGMENTVLTMNASIVESGSTNINKYIQNKELYTKNKAQADADYTEFESYVNEMMEV